MDDKEKEKKEEEKETKKEKKKESLSPQDEQLKQLEDEIKGLLEDMKIMVGDDNVPDVKVVSSNKISKKKILLFQLIEWLLSIAILVGLTGYVKWFRCEKLYNYFIVIGGLTIIEFIISYLVNRFMVKAIFYSFGIIMLLPTVIAFTLGALLIPLVGTIDFGKLILVGILYMLVKRIIMRFIKGNNSSIKIKTIKK